VSDLRSTAGQHRRRFSAAAVLSGFGAMAAHGLSQVLAAESRVVATFSILASMVQEVAPAGFQINALVGPDADAHVFEPTPADSRRLARADLVVANGLGFEGWIDRLIKASGYRGVVLVASREVKPLVRGRGAIDPHAWQDLANARRYVATIAAGLTLRWPAHREEISVRTAAYLESIDALDSRVRSWIGSVPRERRRIITSHDAFGYFGAAYGVDFYAPRGWSTGSEPSAAAVARLVRQIREQNVRSVFLENISDARLLERIASESGSSIGGTLFSDALSAPDGPAPTYLKMFEHNARTIALALG